jgi:hypothetical protein
MVQQLVRFHELARSDVPSRQRPSRPAVAVRCVSGRFQTSDEHVQQIKPIQRSMAQAAAGVLLPALLHVSAVFPASAAVELSPSNPLVSPLSSAVHVSWKISPHKPWSVMTFPSLRVQNDGAKIVSSELRPKITKQLQEFEE